MRNITALTILVIMIKAFFVNNPAYSQAAGRSYDIFIEQQLGFVNGQALEIVYSLPEAASELLSELTWDMKPVFYLGLKVDIELIDIMRRPGIFSSLSFKAGIPEDTGVLENRDWMFRNSDAMTHFSSHTNRTNRFIMADAVIGASIPVASFMYIKPFISGIWMNFWFTGRDGHGEYPWGNEVFSGDVIHYEQNWYLAAAGISLGTRLLFPFTFDFSFQISPFAFCDAFDEHIERRIIFRDYTSNGLFMEPAVSVSYTIRRRVKLSFDFAYRHIGRTRGTTYVNENDTGNFLVQEESGAGLSLTDMRLRLRFFL
jgi:outer membrane protease